MQHFVFSIKALLFRLPRTRFIMTSCLQQATKHVKLSCSPLSAMMDKKVTIDLEGLEPNQKVSLQAKLVGDSNDRYHSLAHYIADQHGRVCMNSQPSVGGSYVGVEPMGFMWSLNTRAKSEARSTVDEKRRHKALFSKPSATGRTCGYSGNRALSSIVEFNDREALHGSWCKED